MSSSSVDAARDTSYDVIVIGTGSGGKIAAQQLAAAGRRVLAVEAQRFGGECPYTACVPAKSLLASAQAGMSWSEAVRRRDEVTDGRDDQGSRDSLTEQGVDVRRGRAVISGRSGDGYEVRIGDDADTTVRAGVVVIGTGSRPSIPPVEGIEDVEYWTSDVALSTREQPSRLGILGGGAVGCELAQAFAALGSSVTLVELADHLLPPEEAWAGQALAEQLETDGVTVRLGGPPQRVEALSGAAGSCRLVLEDGSAVEVDRLLVAGGRSPNSDDLGLEALGVSVGERGEVEVDDHCRVLDEQGEPLPGLYAVGDVTWVSAYTHSANYQAKIVARDLTGAPDQIGPAADYRAVPRVVYTEPTVFCVGLTEEQAREQGHAIATARVDVADVERATLLEVSGSADGHGTVRGGLSLVLDTSRRVVVGAACVGPQADAWGAELALAIKAEIDVDVLRDHVRAFPTWSEAITAALDELPT